MVRRSAKGVSNLSPKAKSSTLVAGRSIGNEVKTVKIKTLSILGYLPLRKKGEEDKSRARDDDDNDNDNDDNNKPLA